MLGRMMILLSLVLLVMISATGCSIPPEIPSEQVEVAVEEDLPGIDDFVRVERPAEMVLRVAPSYPRIAEQAGIQGKVWIKVLVNKRGEVVDAVVFKSSGAKGLDMAALSVAWQNKFRPAVQNGEPVAVWVAYDVDFVLDKEKQ